MHLASPIRRFHTLVESGELRFVYVIGVARSNSTLVCRMLGERLDGAVYEPATPASRDPARRAAQVILRAYDEARRRVPANQPVALAIKDLSLFVDDAAFAFIVAHAAQIVFTIREPVAQHASLMRQLGLEFSVWQRVKAVVGHPFEAFWMAWYFLVYGRRFLAAARASLGVGLGPRHRLAMAGWSLTGWRRTAALFAATGSTPVLVLDAAQMRAAPEEATSRLAAVASSVRPQGIGLVVEVAGHSRMHRDATWAAEARASRGIKPPAEARAAAPTGPVERKLIDTVTPLYTELVNSPANPFRAGTIDHPYGPAGRPPGLPTR